MQNISEAELQAMEPKVIVRYATWMIVFVTDDDSSTQEA